MKKLIVVLLSVFVVFVVTGCATGPKVREASNCFSNECFNISQASGMLVDGFNMPVGEYTMTTKLTSGGKTESTTTQTTVYPDSVIRIDNDVFDMTMDMNSGTINKWTVKGDIGQEAKAIIKDVIDGMAGKFKLRGYVKSGDILKDNARMSMGQLGRVNFKMMRHVLGITKYNGKNYAAVKGKISGKFAPRLRGVRVSAVITTMSLHDPSTGIAMHTWFALEVRSNGKVERMSHKSAVTITRR